MILNTEAIVIASQKYGDSSKIITFFTKDFGIIKAIAKGSLQIKSKFGSALEILSYDNINFYSKPEGHLQLLSDAEILRPFYNLSKSLEHITIGFALCETILKTLDEQYKNPIIFGYLVESLNCLNNLSLNPANILIKFLINLSYTLGFGINFDNNEIENEHSPSKFNKQKYLLNLENGNFKIINNYSNNNENFDIVDIKLLKKIYNINNLPINNIGDIEFSMTEISKIINILSKYYHYHLGKYFYLESMRLLVK